MDALARLQELLRSLFQYDLADLDFGLYRLLKLRRNDIEQFLNQQLEQVVTEAFAAQSAESRDALRERVDTLASRVREVIGADAIDANGQVTFTYASPPKIIADYQQARQSLDAVEVTESARNEVFNHLYAFFSRYYEGGDFIPKRRYGRLEQYAVPYNGEETFFTWANRDQYYVKSGERFRDYAFTVPVLGAEARVRFRLVEASTTPGNAKGDTRYFFPLPERVTLDEADESLLVPFEYRVPGAEEVRAEFTVPDGRRLKGQEAILARAEADILVRVPDDALAAALAEKVDGGTTSRLLKRLRHFEKKNTTDFFIHKNLRGFLERELEFYLKDQFLHLEDMEGDLTARLCSLRVLRRIATDIISFLAQVEDFQKRVWEKRKLVLRADWLAPVARIGRALWPEVLANEAQVAEWRELYRLEPERALENPDGVLSEAVLEAHPGLVVNTAHFPPEFTDRLLAGFPDLDEATDAVLIHSENEQALRLLLPRYAGSVKCIYIDPPYNTGSSAILYKNDYKHSSWCSLLRDRLAFARLLLTDNGALFVSIDKTERTVLEHALDDAFGSNNHIEELIWTQATANSQLPNYSTNHEYVEVYLELSRFQAHEERPARSVRGAVQSVDITQQPGGSRWISRSL
jgi:adenine-specific DNA-methyltransferase